MPTNVELGQACFGNKWSQYNAPDFITAGFLLLEHEIQRVEWNIRQKSFETPLGGGAWCGSIDSYKNKVFEIHPYYWGEHKHLSNRPNFKCGRFEVRWYKYMGRGMTMNMNVDANKFFKIIGRCMKYLQSKDPVVERMRRRTK